MNIRLDIKFVISEAVTLFSKVEIENKFLEIRLLFSHATGYKTEFILMNPDFIITDVQREKFLSFVKRRIQYEPIAYILGYKEFYGRKFYVNKSVLIPRPDTESLVEYIINYCKNYYKNSDKNKHIRILELGVGSGNISITIAKEIKFTTIVAADISLQALRIAKLNAQLHLAKDRIFFIKSNWYSNIIRNNNFDIIVSNPPYISISEKDIMSAEVKKYEPHIALFSDDDGLESYSKIICNAKFFLRPGGILCFEFFEKKYDAIQKILSEHNFKIIDTVYDLSGAGRVIVAQQQ